MRPGVGLNSRPGYTHGLHCNWTCHRKLFSHTPNCDTFGILLDADPTQERPALSSEKPEINPWATNPLHPPLLPSPLIADC